MFGQGLNFGGLTGGAGFDAFYLVVAGGGGGGFNYAAGGGAGGLLTNYNNSVAAIPLSLATNYAVTVGDGGNASNSGANRGNNGTNSIFSNIISTGGGGGGSNGASDKNGLPGGSGGGGAGNNSAASTGIGGTATVSPTQGNNGGNGFSGSGGAAGGGGGAGGAGGTGSTGQAGAGGLGLANSITGTSTFYAGGGGSNANGTNSNGGSSIGGNGGNPATNGVVNTGSGGGGSGTLSGSGGSGTVILRYPTAEVSSFAVTGTLNTPSTVDTIADTAYPIANSAYYKLDSNGNDSSGNGINGTVNNVSFGNGRFNNAGNFNGTNSSIYLGSTAFQYTSLTISAWIYPTAASFATILNNYESGGSPQNSGWMFRMNGDRTILFGGYANSGNYGLASTTTVPLNTWTNVIVTFSPTASALYFNSVLQPVNTGGFGALYGTIDYSTGGNNNGNPTSIGRLDYTGGSGSYFTGKIDQLRVFNSYLSANNVTLLANEHFQTKFTDGTDSILQFTGGSGDITFS